MTYNIQLNVKLFGARLRLARERKGLTQEELVDRVGQKSRAAISEYEAGKRKLSAIDLPDFARALDVPITYFFSDEARTDTEYDTAILDWFHTIPKQKRKWVIEALPKLEPFIIGEKDSK